MPDLQPDPAPASTAVVAAVAAGLAGLRAFDDVIDLLPQTAPSPVASILHRADEIVSAVNGAGAGAGDRGWSSLWATLQATFGDFPTDVDDDGAEVPDIAYVAATAPLRADERELLRIVASTPSAAEGRAAYLSDDRADRAPQQAIVDLVRALIVSAWIAGWSPADVVAHLS